MSNSPEISRRDLLLAGVAATAVTGAGLGGFYFGYNKAIGSPVRVGVIGTGDEGSVLIGALKPEFVEVKAIADIRPFNQFRAFHGDWTNKGNKPTPVPVRLGLMSIYGWKTETEARKHVKVYGPYQELLENAKKDGIEAIIIATPLHLHAPIAIAAMKQGLHVITEKLMAHTIQQCKEMTRVADAQNLYLAIGHQRHYNIKYWQAKDWIQRGVLGEVHSIRAQWHRGNLPPPSNDSWKVPLPPGVKQEDMPVKLDAEIVKARRALEQSYGSETEGWLKVLGQLEAQVADKALEKSSGGKQQVQSLGYEGKKVTDAQGNVVYECTPLEELIRWRLWDHTSAGMMAELGSHQLDAACIFVSALYPEGHAAPASAAGRGGGQPPHLPARSRHRGPRLLHPRIPHARIRREGQGNASPQDLGAVRLDQRQRLPELRRAGLWHQGHARPGEGRGPQAPHRQRRRRRHGDGGQGFWGQRGPDARHPVQRPCPQAAGGGPGGGPVSRGYAEELEHWAWCIRHPAGEPAPLPSPRGHGRRDHCLDDQSRRADRPAHPLQARVV